MVPEILLGRNPTIDDVITPSPGIIANFDGSGEPFTEDGIRSAAKGSVIPGDLGSDGGYYALLENVGDAGNYISFESSEDYTDWRRLSFQMDVLVSNVAADGFGVNFLSTEVHGNSGVIGVEGVEERAVINNSFGVGFRTFQGTNATISWDGLELSGDGPYFLIEDEWVSVGIDLERDPVTKDTLVDVLVYDEPNRQGTAESVCSLIFRFRTSHLKISGFSSLVAPVVLRWISVSTISRCSWMAVARMSSGSRRSIQ